MHWSDITAVVEGAIDEAAAKKLASVLNIHLQKVYGLKGKRAIVRAIHGYNRAAARSPWWVLLDLDHDTPCAASYISQLLPRPERHMKLRIAVRAIEAWFLADRQNLAPFLRIRVGALPASPEALPDPKRALIDLARASTSSRVRGAVVPRAGSGRPVGPGYAAMMIEFARDHWDPLSSHELADSLARCHTRLPLQT